MLRLRSLSQIAFVTLALCAASPALGQGLGERLSDAEKKLDSDIRGCKPVNIAEYQSLVIEATRNKARAEKAAKGIPVDTTQVAADLAKANDLLLRATSAAASRPCPPQQQPQPPKQAPIPPKLVPAQPGGIGGEIEVDPWTQLKLEAWDLFEDLDDAIWDCDLDAVKKLIPELEDLSKRAHQVASTAKAAGKLSKIKPEDAQKLADSIDYALADAKWFKGCSIFLGPKSTPAPKTAPGKNEKPGQPSKSTLNDLFKQPEKPTSPKHSIIEDLREPGTPFEVRAIRDRVSELGKLTRDYPNLLEGCHPGIWDKHIAHLEDLAKRARQIAEDAKRGYSKGVDVGEAERVANEAEKEVNAAKQGKAANEKQWRVPECPKTAPQPKGENTHGMNIPSQPSPYQNVGTNQMGPYAGGLTPPTTLPEARTAKQEYDAIGLGWSGIGMGFAMSDGCDQQQLQRYVVGLEGLARRARALVPLAREGGEFSTVKADQAQKLADAIQRHIDEAKQFVAVDCPAGARFKMNPWNGQILAIHNQERAAVGAEPLRWDPVLAAHADSYAQQLARLGQLTHSPREGRGIERENLGQGRTGWSPADIARNEWMSEKRFFHAGIYPNVCLSGDWQQCSHYSQAIWDTTTDIGCGYAVGSGSSWLVCRYSPGGNKDNYPVGYYDPWSRGISRVPPPPPPPPPPP